MIYNIPPIETNYRGRQYRSRLEAKWAAFFDLLQWQHEYEPFDLGAWSPDFLIPEFNLLVEVKPITEFHQETYSKMWKATRSSGPVSLLLLGVAPKVWNRDIHIGWYGSPDPKFDADDAIVAQLAPGKRGRFADGITTIRDYVDNEDIKQPPSDFAPEGMELWARASNLVQWLPQ